MEKIIIVGNSGSGKSTLAKMLANELNLSHLDLDTIAWKAEKTVVRESLAVSIKQIENFISLNEKWVIEGCYASLLTVVSQYSDFLIFLNPGIETCINNCYSRPWEKHKYISKKAQNQNLPMLINWVKEYETRQDDCSLTQHQLLFNSFCHHKLELKSNLEIRRTFRSLIISNKTKNQMDF
jgi:adenylate kinase family enzyme